MASPILVGALPVNLYPRTFLLPSGNLLIQSNWATVLLDYSLHGPGGGRPCKTSPTPCAATPNIKSDAWEVHGFNIPQYAASASRVGIMPDVSDNYTEEAPLPEGRSIGDLILLPDGTIWMGNDAAMGTAGYGNTMYTVDQSYAYNALISPAIYNGSAPSGSRWSRDGFSTSTVPQMYHVFVSGSNPNSEYNAPAKFPAEYRVETRDVLPGVLQQAAPSPVVVIRTGFSTRTINMGMHYVELDSSYTGNADGLGTLHVAQLPPNAAILAPGPALLFVIVDGVPSLDEMIIVGGGKIRRQPTLSAVTLPARVAGGAEAARRSRRTCAGR
ncbi:copper radical oxidase [Athelia psychrophila]|uniref:Copper radical oxidase n=1 Tax=Athelia psychrophila TaxID=1759441 RepID=A0A167UN59_9AGAM|nr:copper radical oxidase [Fibularhizoctonia sp. CBS 109695]